MTRLVFAWLLAASGTLGGCALVLGFEDHEPFPAGSAGGAGGIAGNGGAAMGGAGGGFGGQGGGGMSGVAVLLIPDRGEKSIGVYDLEDGTYLGDFVPPPTGTEPYALSSPNIAVQGPDELIYVADQLEDAIVRFRPDGSFHDIFADASDGLDNLRGVDFRDGELFVSVSPPMPFVGRFDLSGNRLADFVADDSDPFDVLFLPNRTMMMANIADPDHVRLYDVDASSFSDLVPIDFPQQIQRLANGNFLVVGWTEALEFEIDGDVVRSLTIDLGRGVYPLENGQWLVCSNAGVQAINPFSQQVVQAVRVGGSFAKIERAIIASLP